MIPESSTSPSWASCWDTSSLSAVAQIPSVAQLWMLFFASTTSSQMEEVREGVVGSVHLHTDICWYVCFFSPSIVKDCSFAWWRLPTEVCQGL